MLSENMMEEEAIPAKQIRRLNPGDQYGDQMVITST